MKAVSKNYVEKAKAKILAQEGKTKQPILKETTPLVLTRREVKAIELLGF